jgi:hypothetical protein
MKEFRIATIALLVTYSVAANAAQVDSPNIETQIKPGLSTNGGRFQLFQGLATINAQGTPFNAPSVFKIDSATGQVWKYEEGQTMDGKRYKHWVPIE